MREVIATLLFLFFSFANVSVISYNRFGFVGRSEEVDSKTETGGFSDQGRACSTYCFSRIGIDLCRQQKFHTTVSVDSLRLLAKCAPFEWFQLILQLSGHSNTAARIQGHIKPSAG